MTTLGVIASIGAGRMGRGIAHAFAYAGYDVLLIDLKARSAIDAARMRRETLDEIDQSLAALSSLGVFNDRDRPGILARVKFIDRDEAPNALARTDVVFEGVPEVMDAKREAFAFACQHLHADTIVASTTSTMLVTQLASAVSHPERFLNAHWLNPAYLIPLVELSPHPGTQPAVVDRLKQLLERIGKVPVVCAAAPGYIVPRMQSLIMNEAMRMVEEGLASPEDVDRAVRYGLGFRYANMGVVEFIDYGGLDTLYYASNYLARNLGDRYAPPAIVEQHMQAGKRGLREGHGIFDWSQVDVPAYRREVLERLVRMLRFQELLPPPGGALRE